MVTLKEKALACNDCHTRQDSRLASVAGVYMPGRDRFDLLNTFGWVAVIGALFAVTFHGLGRMFTNGRNGRR